MPSPFTAVVWSTGGVQAQPSTVMRGHVLQRLAAPETEHELQLVPQSVGTGTIRLVHNENVRDLHEPSLERLNRVTGLGHEHHHRTVRVSRDVQLTLSNA